MQNLLTFYFNTRDEDYKRIIVSLFDSKIQYSDDDVFLIYVMRHSAFETPHIYRSFMKEMLKIMTLHEFRDLFGEKSLKIEK